MLAAIPIAALALVCFHKASAGYHHANTTAVGKHDPTVQKAEPRYMSDNDLWDYHHKYHHHYGGYKAPRPKMPGIGELLTFLAPLAAIPLIGGAALTTISTLFGGGLGGLGSLGGLGLLGKRRRRDASVHLLEYPVSVLDRRPSNEREDPMKEAADLDVIQKYLNKVRPNGGYNDEIIATYLSCSGMLDANNHCLERLVCQFSTPAGGMSELEKDVTSLIVYSIMKNAHIGEDFKTRLRRAAFFGREYNSQCGIYTCNKLESKPGSGSTRSLG